MKYLIAFIALILPSYLIRFDVLGIPTTLLEIVINLVFLYGFFKIGYCQLLKCKSIIWIPITLLVLGAIIGVIVSPDKITALGQFKALFLDPLLVLWLVVCYLEEKDYKLVISALGISTLFVSVYTIVQRLIGNVTTDGRVVGIFGYSPNYTALFLAPITGLLSAYALQLFTRKKNLWGVIFGSASLINLIALYFTGSRGALLAYFAGMLVYFIVRFRVKIWGKLWSRIALIAGLLLIIIASWWAFKPNFQASGGRVVSSNNLRWQIWETTIELGKKQPVTGVGLGNYQNAFDDLTKDRVNFPEFITPMAASSHNIFLMFWLATGVLGLTGFTWLLFIFFQTAKKNIKKDSAKILLSGMAVLIFSGLVDTPYFKNDYSLIFWLIFGLMLLLNKAGNEDLK